MKNTIGKCVAGRIYKSNQLEVTILFNGLGMKILKKLNRQKGTAYLDMRMVLGEAKYDNEYAELKKGELMEISVVPKKK